MCTVNCAIISIRKSEIYILYEYIYGSDYLLIFLIFVELFHNYFMFIIYMYYIYFNKLSGRFTTKMPNFRIIPFQGELGSSTAALFLFVRYLLMVNIGSAIFWMGLVVVPQVFEPLLTTDLLSLL